MILDYEVFLKNSEKGMVLENLRIGLRYRPGEAWQEGRDFEAIGLESFRVFAVRFGRRQLDCLNSKKKTEPINGDNKTFQQIGWLCHLMLNSCARPLKLLFNISSSVLKLTRIYILVMWEGTTEVHVYEARDKERTKGLSYTLYRTHGAIYRI
ncbi:hypothetical protein EYR41_005823 [Orbilia oligospora]|uniref:Uncharacterized protein n=1 Tax=Orbilia oligospora TaxID=2813651 RepID=A0A8H2HRY4_ORBOL|nr:hypothetical protein EYR41_005823 [Orbilia oligospora]